MVTDALLAASLETLVMVAVSGTIAALLGLPLAVALVVTSPGHLTPHPLVHRALASFIDAVRSVPFVILLVAVIPLTRAIVGTTIGTAAAIVPLALSAVPFVARLYEESLRQLDASTLEAARSFGATPFQIVTRVLVPEAVPGLIASSTVMIVSLTSASAMAGAVGGGGLGDLGIRYGYQRFQPEVMAAVVVLLIAFVTAVQRAGDWLARRAGHRGVS